MTQSVIMGKLYSEANVMVKTATEFFLGGQARVDVASNKMDYQAPQGGVGGVWGGVLRGGTLRLVPMENNPTDASRAGMDAGAAQVPFLDAGARLATGTTAGGHEASRGEAALELGLQVGLVAAGTKLQSLNAESKVASEIGAGKPKTPLNEQTKTGPISPEKANARHVENGNRPPYAHDKPARDIELKSERTFARVHTEDNQAGSWLVRPEEIKGLAAKDIQDKLALPTLPKYVSDVKVPAGARLRVGTAGEQAGWGQGGGIQYESLDYLNKSSFTNMRVLP